MQEPWDELMGPPSPRRDPSESAAVPQPETPMVAVRQQSNGSSPPAALFRTSSNSSGPPAAAFNNSGAAVALPWSQRSTSSSGGGSSVASRTGSAFEDEDMVISGEAAGIADPSRGLHHHFEIGSAKSNDSSDDDEFAIGRAYDIDHDHIRQEALRMLEVADADEHYSVHRTITGGFTAQAKSLGHQKRTKTALRGLHHLAARRPKINTHNHQQQPFFDDSGNAPEAAMSTTTRNMRDGYDYQDESVVDVVGLEERSAFAAAAETPYSNHHTNNSWSSRYSIDSTMLAMSGGAMKQKLDRMDREHHHKSERFSARNMFGNSPKETRSPQIFGSGFAFRQQHIFGKQNVVTSIPPASNNNLQAAVWSDHAGTPANHSPKTWQEQLLHKRQQQRRWLVAICLVVLCFLVTFVSVSSHQKKRNNPSSSSSIVVPADGTNGSVTFAVVADTPYTTDAEDKLKHNLASAFRTTAFSVHLGNLQNVSETECSSSTYTRVADLLEVSSPETIFVVPGEQDWNDCPNPGSAWAAWKQSFLYFDQRWDNTANVNKFRVYRQQSHHENWAFVYSNVLFVGVHVVNGVVPNQTEFADRNALNYRWVMGMCTEHSTAINAVVVFGNAKPGYPENVAFFAPLELFWITYVKPILYVHASSGFGASETHQPFADLSHVLAARIENDPNKPPIQINVGSGENPFIIG